MKAKDNPMKAWQREAEGLRLSPSVRVWERLENRLDQDKGKVSIRHLRKWLTLAASVIVLIAAGFLINQGLQPVMTVVEELEGNTSQPYMAVYRHASDIKAAYADGNWVHIKEGSREKLKTSRLHAPVDYVPREDTL